jgi:hypothetical protein
MASVSMKFAAFLRAMTRPVSPRDKQKCMQFQLQELFHMKHRGQNRALLKMRQESHALLDILDVLQMFLTAAAMFQ